MAAHLAGSEFSLVGTARNAVEALARHAELKPDIVLLDIVMPGDTGVTVLKALRAADPTVRIAMVSSLGMEDTVLECLKSGADSFLQKPFTKELLLALLRRIAGAVRVPS